MLTYVKFTLCLLLLLLLLLLRLLLPPPPPPPPRLVAEMDIELLVAQRRRKYFCSPGLDLSVMGNQ